MKQTNTRNITCGLKFLICISLITLILVSNLQSILIFHKLVDKSYDISASQKKEKNELKQFEERIPYLFENQELLLNNRINNFSYYSYDIQHGYQRWIQHPNETCFNIGSRVPIPIHPTIPHNPIAIHNNNDFASQSWPGIGTPSDPYRIEDLEIDIRNTTGPCIRISNTNAYFLINNCLLIGEATTDDYSILLSNVTNGYVANNYMNNTIGIQIENSCSNNIVTNNTYDASDIRVYSSSHNNTITSNIGVYSWVIFENSNFNIYKNNNFSHTYVYLTYSNNNTIRHNLELDLALYFSDNNTIINNKNYAETGSIYLSYSYNNEIANNIISKSSNTHISLYYSCKNTLVNNTLASAYYGIIIQWSPENNIINNTLSQCGLYIVGNRLECRQGLVYGNWVNGKPLIFWQDKITGIISNDYGQVILVNCTSIIVKNQVIENITCGILLLYTDSSVIVNNTVITSFDEGVGISLENSQHNTVSNNTVTSYQDSIEVIQSKSTLVEGNNCTGKYGGIFFYYSDSSSAIKNILTSSELISDSEGILIFHSEDVNISHNLCMNYGIGIEVWASDTINIAYNNCSQNSNGIEVVSSIYCNVFNNSCVHNHYGISLVNLESIILSNNTCNLNYLGIQLVATNFSLVSNNNCSFNLFDGLRIVGSSYYGPSQANNITNNIFRANLVGVGLYHGSESNIITGNLLIDNTHPETDVYYNAYCVGVNNVFDKNYWSDYTGTDHDGDGYGDTPYSVSGSGDASDPHPIMLLPNSPLVWLNTPGNIIVIQGSIFIFDLDATATPPGVDCWWLNDSQHFTITHEGILLCSNVLEVKTYGLQVFVNDTRGNVLSTTFSVSVLPSLVVPGLILLITTSSIIAVTIMLFKRKTSN